MPNENEWIICREDNDLNKDFFLNINLIKNDYSKWFTTVKWLMEFGRLKNPEMYV